METYGRIGLPYCYIQTAQKFDIQSIKSAMEEEKRKLLSAPKTGGKDAQNTLKTSGGDWKNTLQTSEVFKSELIITETLTFEQKMKAKKRLKELRDLGILSTRLECGFTSSPLVSGVTFRLLRLFRV